jgi:chorismate dehydratase
MQKIKLTAVSYINTIPFIEAINNSPFLQENIKLLVDYPARCAQYLENKEADGGLVPVGALSQLSSYQIMTNFCIGANGKVDTVAILAQQKLKKIKTIYLDYQSRTSVKLLQILALRYWKQDFTFLKYTDGIENNLKKDEAVLLIGDRVFEYQNLFLYKIDLAEEWKQWTNLPFVFAVWVGNKRALSLEKELNINFEKYQKNIPGLYKKEFKIKPDIFVDYLENKIDFVLDKSKRKSIQLFLKILEEEKNTII